MSTVNEKEKEESVIVKIADLLFKGEMVKGDAGIEVEVEGKRLPNGGFGYWQTTRDGSLRGEEAYEYVFREPLPLDVVPKALSELYKGLSKSKVDDSGRAGVHVHVNIRDLEIQELFSFMMLYLVFEEVLVDFCGEDRKGNLFCLRASDAEFLILKIRSLFQTINFGEVARDEIRYSSMNLTAIRKYGSLEFRSLPSPVPEEKINTWVGLLFKLKEKAKELRDPRLVVTSVSEYGGEDFAKSVFGDLINQLKCDNWNYSVIKGMRRIQPLVPCINWEYLAKVESETKARMESRKKDREGDEGLADSLRGRGVEINAAITADWTAFGEVPTIRPRRNTGVPVPPPNLNAVAQDARREARTVVLSQDHVINPFVSHFTFIPEEQIV